MNKKIRQQVYDKYDGKCAYTGQPLDNTWQVDHVIPQRMYTTYNHYYEHRYTKEVISTESYFKNYRNYSDNGRDWDYKVDKIFDSKLANSIDNLVPSLRIINHYKRDHDLESFRIYIMNLHIRLSKLPKKTSVQRTIERKEYLYNVALLFGITIETPFNGKFYFETL